MPGLQQIKGPADVLKAARQVLNTNAQMAQLTDLEKAQAIVYLAAQP